MSTPPIQALGSASTTNSIDSSYKQEPFQGNRPKTSSVDTITCCCPCFGTIWDSICNFLTTIWNLLCCKSQTKNKGRNWADNLLKNRYENVEATPSYEGLDQSRLLISPSHRHLYVEFLMELIDVKYEPKRSAIPLETIKIFIRKIALPTDREAALIKLCDTCARKKTYDLLLQQFRELEDQLTCSDDSKDTS